MLEETKQRVLVTGAGGFIGGRGVEMLHFHPGFDVRAGIRRWSSAARIGRFPVELVHCDLLDRSSLQKALEGVTDVIHCAKGGWEVNVEGTRQLLEASLEGGVRRFVHMSTIDVYGDATGQVTEDTPLATTGKEYGDSKIAAEAACLEAAGEGFSVVILRPTIVYGPFSDLWTVEFAERMQVGPWPFPDELCRGTCNLVYVDDLIHAAVVALRTPDASGQAFNVNGPDRPSWNTYFRTLAGALGIGELRAESTSAARRRARMFSPVRKTARFVLDHFEDQVLTVYKRSALAKRMMKAAEAKIKSAPTSAEFELYSKELDVSAARASEVLGFDPMVSMECGVDRSVEWLRHHGYLG